MMVGRYDENWRKRHAQKLVSPAQAVSRIESGQNVYVGGWMQGAIGDALRKAGVQGPPEVGGQLTVTLTERQPNENPVLAPINKFQATYVPASAQATGQFFNGSQPQAPVGPPPQPAPVPGFQGAYAPPGGYPQHMQPQAQQPVPQQAAPQQPQQYPGYVGAPAPVPPGTLITGTPWPSIGSSCLLTRRAS